MMFDAPAVVRKLQQALPSPLCGVSSDSKKVKDGVAFLAYPGTTADGRDYIGEAIDCGAPGVFWESDNFAWPQAWQKPNVAVAGLRARAGLLADVVYEKPGENLFIAAITATNGKTTIAHFAAQLLNAAGTPTAQIGTLGAGFIGALTATENTTPDAAVIHRLLATFQKQNARAVMLEASSHGICQYRLAGVRAAAAVLANVGRDHLDYHGNLANYWQSKARLFDGDGLQNGIFNGDDDFCRALADDKKTAMTTLTYGKRGDDLRLLSAVRQNEKTILKVDGVFGEKTVVLNSSAAHDIENFLAAALIAHIGGANWDAIETAAFNLQRPRGRLQKIGDADGLPVVYVDYAHKPEALRAVLLALREICGDGKKLWAVFGCGGGRDSGKRAQMGKTAATLADVAVVTDDNPRWESASAIRAQIAAADKKLTTLGGRESAIAYAVQNAAAGDIILIAGKGHETTQIIGDEKIPFSDEATARRYLAKRSDQ